jgi:hypothetical protein
MCVEDVRLFSENLGGSLPYRRNQNGKHAMSGYGPCSTARLVPTNIEDAKGHIRALMCMS